MNILFCVFVILDLKCGLVVATTGIQTHTTHSCTDKKTQRHIDRNTDKHTYIIAYTNTHTHRQADTYTHHKQTHRNTDTQTDYNTHRHIFHTHTHTHTHI